MPASKAKVRANTKYNKKRYDNTSFRTPKEDRINDRLELASQKVGKSKSQYIIDAIMYKFEEDGIPELEPIDEDQEES